MSEHTSHTEIKMGSERSFGLVFASVFLIIAFFPLIHGGGVRIWSICVSIGFLIVALVMPKLLQPLNRLWFKFGLLLGSIMSPIVMGILFIVTVVPTGLVMRLLGKDLLRKKLDPNCESYWIHRNDEQNAASSMKDQF